MTGNSKPEGHGDGQWGEIPPGLKLCCILPGHEEWIHHLAWSPDGHLLASASKDTTIRLWNVETEGLARILKGHDDFALSVTWSPDGQMLASGSDDHTIRLWCVNSEKEVLRLTEHTDSVVSVAWSRDGSRLASGSNDNDIALWDVRTLRDVATASLHGKNSKGIPVLSAAWYGPRTEQGLPLDPDDHTVRLWNTDTQELLRTLQGHARRVTSVVSSPDGRMLASGIS